MNLQKGNQVVAMPTKETLELQEQAEKFGLHVYQPKMRSRVNSQFLSATLLKIQQENLAAEVNEMLRAFEKKKELDSRLKRTEAEICKESRSCRIHCSSDVPVFYGSKIEECYSSEDGGMTKEEVENFLHSRVKRGRGSVRQRVLDEAGYHMSASCSELCTSTEREIEECYSGGTGGMTDGDVEEFLHSRVKRGRGSVGSRMNERGPMSFSCPEAKRNRLGTFPAATNVVEAWRCAVYSSNSHIC